MNRRDLLAAATLGSPFFLHAAPQPLVARAAYTANTAPDEAGRLVLRGRIRDPFARAPSFEAFAIRFSRDFPQLIEQHFAALDPDGAALRFDALSEAELSDIAQLYVNANYEAGRPGLLLPVLASRLDGRRLGRLSEHFGFGPVYEWVTRLAPRQSERFLNHAAMDAHGPVPGEDRFGPNGRLAPQHGKQHKMGGRWGRLRTTPVAGFPGITQFLYKSPTQVYTMFRSAEHGSYSVGTALLETMLVFGGLAHYSYEWGYEYGTLYLLPVVQTYAPDLYHDIGGTIDMAIWNLKEAHAYLTSDDYHVYYDAQMAAASMVKLQREQREALERTGGDYGVVVPPPAHEDESGVGGSGSGGSGSFGDVGGSDGDGSGSGDPTDFGDYGDPGYYMGP